MDELPPLPRYVSDSLLAALVLISGAGIILALLMPTLRQGRLIDRAQEVCEQRAREANKWLEREDEATQALRREWESAEARGPKLLRVDDEVPVRNFLHETAAKRGFRVDTLELGTVRRGEAFDALPVLIRLTGDRAELPPFLADFYGQDRLVRLVALDLETPSFDTDAAVVTLRWEYAAPAQRRRDLEDPVERWSPPALCARSSLPSVAAWNRGRWQRMDRAATELRRMAPRLRKLATIEAERRALDRERAALTRWEESSEAEARAVLRKVPALIGHTAVSALGRAGLRPGPGGTLQIVDDD